MMKEFGFRSLIEDVPFVSEMIDIVSKQGESCFSLVVATEAMGLSFDLNLNKVGELWNAII